jgi:hypothetical protein
MKSTCQNRVQKKTRDIMAFDGADKKNAANRCGCFLRLRAILTVTLILGLCFASENAHAATPTPTPAACNPGVTVGGACSTIGQTAMDCQNDNVLYCLRPPGQAQGQTGQWFIVGTNTIPTCGGLSALTFDGNYFRCVPFNFPTCPSGQFLTSYDGGTVTCVDPNNPTAPTPTPAATAPIPTPTPTSGAGTDPTFPNATDLTGQMQVQTYTFGAQANLEVLNTGDSPINGPIQVVLTNLTPGVTVTNGNMTSNNLPYVTVTTGSLVGRGILVGAIQFNNPSGGPISFTAIPYSGSVN